MQTVAVFFGGRSNEREISVITGIYAVNLLRSSFETLPIYLDEENQMYLCPSARDVKGFAQRIQQQPLGKEFVPVQLMRGGLGILKGKKVRKEIKLDCALNCCHGGLGEGGGLSMLLSWNQIVSASPQAAPSEIFLDKILAKIFLQGADVPVVPYETVREKNWREDGEEAMEKIEGALEYPVIVKPSKLGSSIGITVARDCSQLRKALDLCFRIDDAALIEKYLKEKRDLNLAAYRVGERMEFSEIEEVFSVAPILSFEEKYEGAAERASKKPAEISEEIETRMREIMTTVCEVCQINGIVRADFLMSEGRLYFNELNTVPGTLATYLFSESLTGAKELLCKLIETAIEREKGKTRKEILQSGVLTRQNFGSKRGKMR